MTTIELTKGPGGRYQAAGVGWLKQKSMLSNDFIGEAVDLGELSFSRNWTGRKFEVSDRLPRVRGQHQREGWGNNGPLEWDDVQYEFASNSMWKGSFALRRHSEELATFTPKRFGRTIEIQVLGNAHVPNGLLLFGAWIILMNQRDAAAS